MEKREASRRESSRRGRGGSGRARTASTAEAEPCVREIRAAEADGGARTGRTRVRESWELAVVASRSGSGGAWLVPARPARAADGGPPAADQQLRQGSDGSGSGAAVVCVREEEEER